MNIGYNSQPTFNHSVDFGLNEQHLFGLGRGNLASLDELLRGTGNGITPSARQLCVVAFRLEQLVVMRLAKQRVPVGREVAVTVVCGGGVEGRRVW